jgi:multiple antibiotic resistance protein
MMDHSAFMTREFYGAFGLALAALLPIINPLGGAPVFLTMTPGASDKVRAMLARRIAMHSTLLLLAAIAGGPSLLAFFGVSLPVIKIAGGLLVITNGWRMLYSESSQSSSPDTKLVSNAPAWNHVDIETRSFFPLTFPLTVGPGSISVAVTISANAGALVPLQLAAQMAGGLAGVLVAGLAIYLCDRYVSHLVRILGDTGSVVLLRMSAFILLAIGVQIMTDGIVGRFHLEGLLQ